MDLAIEITLAESLYRQKLEDYFNLVFRRTNIISHGLGHHRRVWGYCRELCNYPHIISTADDPLFAVKLIIAAYLHDTGMSVDPGPDHGLVSSGFTRQFLESQNLSVNSYTDLLEAVEQHDNKNYVPERKESIILRVLNLADDLDALGYTGIYRYIEIYIERKVKYAELADRIRSNVETRFNNFLLHCGSASYLINRHKPRYRLIAGYCAGYNEQLPGYTFGTLKPSGYCGIAELIGSSAGESEDTEGLFSRAEKLKNDHVIKNFFDELKKEIE